MPTEVKAPSLSSKLDCKPLTEEEIETLLRSAVAAREHSYSPYSKFPVGAALLSESGEIYHGCNVENASYGLCICAERTAFVKAVSAGERKFRGIAITSKIESEVISPCGACRQFLVEFGNIEVFMSNSTGTEFSRISSYDLLPHGFVPSKLEI